MRQLTYILIAFIALCIAGCNRNKGLESAKKYKLIGCSKEIATVSIDSLFISDPHILADEATRTYYLTGSGGTLWKSSDLKRWKGPYSYIEIDTASWIGPSPMVWAAELHKYKEKYYCFAAFTNLNTIIDTIPDRYNVHRRATHVLVADKAEGPYRPAGDDIYLPENWSTLDGTLWEEDGKPYLVFCHEWVQTVDGIMKYVELSPDLSGSIGDPVSLFKSSDAPWTREMSSIGELTFGLLLNGYVVDGPFLFHTDTGKLGMLWSSWGDTRYAQGVAYSESGKLAGPWVQLPTPLVPDNSGHGMLFRTFEGKPLMAMHRQSLDPENVKPRKLALFEVDLSGDSIRVLGEHKP